jgi:uncharacterized alkaline shock family protein YloU
MSTTEQTKSDSGTIHIAPEVIEVISGLATLEIEGVAGMIGGFASGVSEMLGRKNVAKGVKVQLQGQEAKVDVSIAIQYGRAIPYVAQAIQYRVKQAIETMTGLTVREVNVHVQDVQFAQPEGQPEAMRPDLL